MNKTNYWGLILILLTVTVLPTKISPKHYRDALFILAIIVSMFHYGSVLRSKTLTPLYFMLAVVGINFLPSVPASYTGIISFVAGLLAIGHLSYGLDWDRLKDFIVLCTVFQMIIITLQYFGLDHASIWGQSRGAPRGHSGPNGFPIVGALENHMVSGSLLAMCTPFLFTKRYCLLLIPATISFYLLDSAMAVVSLCGLVLFFIRKIESPRTIVIGTILVGCVVAGCLWLLKDLPYLYPGERLQVWKVSLLDSPIWGNGIGFFQRNFHKMHKFNEVFLHPHNELIMGLYVFGPIIVLLIVGYLCHLFFRTWRYDIHFSTCFLIAVINSMGAFPLHIASTALLFIVCIARLMNIETKIDFRRSLK